MLSIKNPILIICCTLLFVAVWGLGISYAINTTSDGHQFTSLQNKSITLADNSCRNVTNNATNRFIPTRTMGEWNSFSAIAAGQGVTIANCCHTEYSCYTANCCTFYNVVGGDYIPGGGGAICDPGYYQYSGWYNCYYCEICNPYTVCS